MPSFEKKLANLYVLLYIIRVKLLVTASYKCSIRRTKCNWNQPGHGSKLRSSDPTVHTRHISKKEEVEKCYGKIEKVMTQLNTGKNRQNVIMGDLLIPHAMKIFCKTMYNRISTKINRQLDPLQFSFRPKVGTVESITALKTILNNRINHGKSTYLWFIDFTKAFDRVEHKMLIDVLKKKGVKQAEIRLICDIYNKQRAFMRNDSERENEIKIKRGVRQGCILSPILFNIYAEEAFRSCKSKNGI